MHIEIKYILEKAVHLNVKNMFFFSMKYYVFTDYDDTDVENVNLLKKYIT